MTTSLATFRQIADLLREHSGLAIGPEKIYLLETRLAPILRREGLQDLNALAGRLGSPASAHISRDVVEAMTTNESFFFRDEKPFRHFRDSALIAIHKARAPGTPIRIWSAAASSGQEAYSLAMLLIDALPNMGGRRVELLATDIARDQLARAREGLYSQFEVQRGLPVQMLVRHFRKEGQGWRLNDNVKRMVEFREWNLLSDPSLLGFFDIVFCRNALIYFDRPTKSRVLECLATRLKEDGYLYLGGAETILGLTDRLVCCSERGVYKRREASG